MKTPSPRSIACALLLQVLEPPTVRAQCNPNSGFKGWCGTEPVEAPVASKWQSVNGTKTYPDQHEFATWCNHQARLMPSPSTCCLAGKIETTNGYEWKYEAHNTWWVWGLPFPKSFPYVDTFTIRCDDVSPTPSSLTPNEIKFLNGFDNLHIPMSCMPGVVDCNAAGRVTGINFPRSGYHLTGTIPPFSLAPELASIEMRDQNDLIGSLPSMSSLSKLSKVHLSWNITYGGVPGGQLAGALPDLSDHPRLTSLRIENNIHITGVIPEFPNGSILKELYLVKIGVTGTIPILEPLSSSLQIILIGDLPVTGTIPSLDSLEQLEELKIQLEDITGTLPSLSGLVKLKSLALDRMKAQLSLSGLAELKFLEHIWIRFCRNETLPLPTLPSLSNSVNLRTLMLSFSHIEGSIPDFGPFSSLEKIVLESTGIWTGESTGLTGTIEGVSNLKNLRILHIETRGVFGTLPSLKALNSLEQLRIGHNGLEGPLLLPTIAPQLVSVMITGTRLGGAVDLTAIGSRSSHLPTEINLYNNLFTSIECNNCNRVLLGQDGATVDIHGRTVNFLAEYTNFIPELPSRDDLSFKPRMEMCDFHANYWIRIAPAFEKCTRYRGWEPVRPDIAKFQRLVRIYAGSLDPPISPLSNSDVEFQVLGLQRKDTLSALLRQLTESLTEKNKWEEQAKYEPDVYLGMEEVSSRPGLFDQSEAESQAVALEEYQLRSIAEVSSLCPGRELEDSRSIAPLHSAMRAISSVLNESFTFTNVSLASRFKKGLHRDAVARIKCSPSSIVTDERTSDVAMAFGKATFTGQAVKVGGEDATQLSVGAIVPASAVNNAPFTLSVIELPPNYGKAVEILQQTPNELTAEILSPVASVTAHDANNGEELPVKGSPEDVVVSFLAPASDANVSCAYYDEASKRWKEEGVRLRRNGNRVECSADHLTDFALLRWVAKKRSNGGTDGAAGSGPGGTDGAAGSGPGAAASGGAGMSSGLPPATAQAWGCIIAVYCLALTAALLQLFRASCVCVQGVPVPMPCKRTLMRTEAMLVTTALGLRVALWTSLVLAFADVPLHLVALLALAPMWLGQVVFGLLAHAWYSMSRGGHSRGNGCITLALKIYFLAVALIAGIVVAGFLLDQETFEACMLAGGYMIAAVSFLNFAAILFFGEKIYKGLTAGGFKSKHSGRMRLFTAGFSLSLVAQACIHVSSTTAGIDAESFGQAIAFAVIESLGYIMVLLVFHEAIKKSRNAHASTKKKSSSSKFSSAFSGSSQSKGRRRGRRAGTASSHASRGSLKSSRPNNSKMVHVSPANYSREAAPSAQKISPRQAEQDVAHIHEINLETQARASVHFQSGADRQRRVIMHMKQSKAKWADLLKNSELASEGRLALEDFKALMPSGMGTKKLFDSLDDDGNGWLDKEEMREFIRTKIREEGKAVSAAMTESPGTGGIKSITAAHYANISRASEQFADGKARQNQLADKMRLVRKEWLSKLKQADLSGEGELDFDEFSAVFKGVPKKRRRELFDSLDSDGNGSLDMIELRALVKMKMRETAWPTSSS